MTDTTENYRWIPATEKPGGLVPYESVVRHIEYGWEGRFISDDDSHTGKRWLISRYDLNGQIEAVSPQNLLVRIDPLPDSTEGEPHVIDYGGHLRRMVNELMEGAESIRDNGLDYSDEEWAAKLMYCAAKLIERRFCILHGGNDQ